MLERLRNLLRDAGHAPGRWTRCWPQAHPHRPGGAKLQAVAAFQQLPEAAGPGGGQQARSSTSSEGRGQPGEPDVALLAEDAEKALFHAIVEVAPLARSHFQNEDYTDALRVLAGLRAAVDRFFDEVMVMAEEPLVRQNRLACWPAGRPDEPGGGHLPPVGLTRRGVP